MTTIASKDGTAIAFDQAGKGPALILVDGALCSRAFGPSPKLAPLLARHFTVFSYDRRGRGASGDRGPYSPAREVDDIAALVGFAGGSATLVGLSSGAALALTAAASGVPLDAVIAYEPPYVQESGVNGTADHERELQGLVDAGQRGAAVKYFMKDMVGAPGAIVMMMRLMPWIWNKCQAVAHTLPYDAAIMTGFSVPRDRFASIRVPVLVMNGGKTDPRLRRAARATAGAIPGASLRELPGQSHNVKPEALATAVTEALTAAPPARWS